MKEQRERLWK